MLLYIMMLVMKFLLIMAEHIRCFLLITDNLINYTLNLNNGASTVLGFKEDLYSSIT